MSKKIVLIFAALLMVFLAACGSPAATPVVTEGSDSTTDTAVGGSLVVYSGRSEALIQPVIDAFKAQYPAVEVLLKSGSNSELANALLEERNNPQADMFVTTELITIQSLASEDVFEAYRPQAADSI